MEAHKIVIPTTGLNEFRDQCSAVMDNGQAGTDSTSPLSTDTALIAPVAATLLPITTTSGTTSVQTSHIIVSTVATGNTFREWSIEKTDTTLLSRAVTAGVTHTSTDEITKITTFNFVDR